MCNLCSCSLLTLIHLCHRDAIQVILCKVDGEISTVGHIKVLEGVCQNSSNSRVHLRIKSRGKQLDLVSRHRVQHGDIVTVKLIKKGAEKFNLRKWGILSAGIKSGKRSNLENIKQSIIAVYNLNRKV